MTYERAKELGLSEDLARFVARLDLKERIQQNPEDEKLKQEYISLYWEKEYWFLLRSIYSITK